MLSDYIYRVSTWKAMARGSLTRGYIKSSRPVGSHQENILENQKNNKATTIILQGFISYTRTHTHFGTNGHFIDISVITRFQACLCPPPSLRAVISLLGCPSKCPPNNPQEMFAQGLVRHTAILCYFKWSTASIWTQNSLFCWILSLNIWKQIIKCLKSSFSDPRIRRASQFFPSL